jgi:hypothetical protein
LAASSGNSFLSLVVLSASFLQFPYDLRRTSKLRCSHRSCDAGSRCPVPVLDGPIFRALGDSKTRARRARMALGHGGGTTWSTGWKGNHTSSTTSP